MRLFSFCCLAAVIVSSPLAARDVVGVGRISNNDSIATLTDDRWRTGSGVLSLVTSVDGTRELPARFGDMIEYRLRGEVISPENIVTPKAGDRAYAAALSLGIHTHFTYGELDLSVGADVVATGPQTGLPTLQGTIHDVIGIAGASDATLATQIPNGFHGALTFEAGRNIDLSDAVLMRPFMELQAGVETMARAGVDFHIGQLARGETMLRDAITGQRYRIGRDYTPGWSGILGADVAYVANSIYLPASSGVVMSDTRARVRAGVHWQTKHTSLFYGLTWMSKEFEAQRNGQTVGTLRLDFKF